ncbi:hypothetical protein, partial [Ferruginibacter sp. HRS2-29]
MYNLYHSFIENFFQKIRSGLIRPVILAVILATAFSTTLEAQVVITYPLAAQQLTRGLDVSKLTVNLGFTGTCTATTVEIRLPAGVEYVQG